MAKKAKKTAKKATPKATAKTAVKRKSVAVKTKPVPVKKSPKNKEAAKTIPMPRPEGLLRVPFVTPAVKAKPKAVQVLTKTYLTDAELAHFKQILLEKLHQLTGVVDSIESEALRRNRADATGDLSSMPIHMADIGSDTFEQDFTLGLMSSERKIVTEIIAALKRIENGTFGICEGTGRPIPKARLEACPWARYCIEYASRLEKGQLTRQEESRRWSRQYSEEEGEEGEIEEDEEEPEEDEDEFEPGETDPDLDDLYEIEDEENEPSADEKPS